MTIADAAAAKKLADAIHKPKDRIIEFRKVRDRQMEDLLNDFKAMLPEKMQQHFVPYQSAEPEHEIQVLKHITVSNVSEIQVIATSKDRGLGKRPQELEDALIALDEALWPQQVALDELDGMFGDGWVGVSLEKIQGSPALSQFSDSAALKAEMETAAEDATDTTTEADPYDDAPAAQYARAYQDALPAADNTDHAHELAYGTVTDNARMADGLRWQIRVIESLTFDPWLGPDGRVQKAVEQGEIELNPCIETYAEYGLGISEDGKRFTLTENGSDAPDAGDPLGAVTVPLREHGGGGVPGGGKMVKYMQIRTLEETIVYLEHPGRSTAADPGCIIRFPNPFGGKSTGYYIIAGNTKLRGNPVDRYDPPILPLLVETQHLNMVKSAMLAMAYAEASRDLYQEANPSPVQPADASRETKSIQTKDGAAPPVAMGTVQRLPETGIDMKVVLEMIETTLDRFRSRELLAGSGSSSETGVHLARLQTQLLTQLVPYQVSRATTRKQILQDFLLFVLASGERVVIPWLPQDQERVAQPREITPAHARLPVVIRYTLGADTPESKAAREQMSQQQTEFGTISMETHMENAGVKDPEAERRLIAKDAVRAKMIGTAKEGGFLVNTVADLLDQYVKAGLAARLGPVNPIAPIVPPIDPNAPPPVDTTAPPPAAMGAGIPADGGGVSPVQMGPAGVPIAAGALPVTT